MTIYREIDGKTYAIELSAEELTKAYYEQQEEFDVEDMIGYMEEFLEDNEEFSEDEVMESIRLIARYYRTLADQHEWRNTAQEAFNYVLV